MRAGRGHHRAARRPASVAHPIPGIAPRPGGTAAPRHVAPRLTGPQVATVRPSGTAHIARAASRSGDRAGLKAPGHRRLTERQASTDPATVRRAVVVAATAEARAQPPGEACGLLATVRTDALLRETRRDGVGGREAVLSRLARRAGALGRRRQRRRTDTSSDDPSVDPARREAAVAHATPRAPCVPGPRVRRRAAAGETAGRAIIEASAHGASVRGTLCVVRAGVRGAVAAAPVSVDLHPQADATSVRRTLAVGPRITRVAHLVRWGTAIQRRQGGEPTPVRPGVGERVAFIARAATRVPTRRETGIPAQRLGLAVLRVEGQAARARGTHAPPRTRQRTVAVHIDGRAGGRRPPAHGLRPEPGLTVRAHAAWRAHHHLGRALDTAPGHTALPGEATAAGTTISPAVGRGGPGRAGSAGQAAATETHARVAPGDTRERRNVTQLPAADAVDAGGAPQPTARTRPIERHAPALPQGITAAIARLETARRTAGRRQAQHRPPQKANGEGHERGGDATAPQRWTRQQARHLPQGAPSAMDQPGLALT